MKRLIIAALTAAGATILLGVPGIAAAKPPAAKTHKAVKVERAWPVETLSGKIMMVNPALNLAVVKADGVPFDMVVTHATRIESGNRTLKLSDLGSDTNRSVSVKFVPNKRGDVARSIQITG